MDAPRIPEERLRGYRAKVADYERLPFPFREVFVDAADLLLLLAAYEATTGTPAPSESAA